MDDHALDLRKYSVNINEYKFIEFAQPEKIELVPNCITY